MLSDLAESLNLFIEVKHHVARHHAECPLKIALNPWGHLR